MIFEYVLDLIPALAKAMGNEFHQYLDKYYTQLILCMKKSNEEIDEKIQVMGVFAQSFKALPQFIELYHDRFIRLFEELLQEKDDALNRNLAFCCGIFCLKRPNVMIQYYPRILKILGQIYDESGMIEAKDNALAALARMAIASPENVPLEEVLF